jgi:hypothetical protein
MSNEDLTDIQEENKTPHEAEADNCQSALRKCLTVKETKDPLSTSNNSEVW